MQLALWGKQCTILRVVLMSMSAYLMYEFLMYLLIETIMDHIETNVCDIHLLVFHPFLQTSASL